MFSFSVTLFRRPRGVGFLLVGSILVVFWKWDSLSWHARGMILGAYGVAFLGFGLIEVLRTRGLLKSGVQTLGTVIGAERDDDTTTTYNPVVQFTTADGRTVEFTSAVGYGSKPDVGGTLDVRYLPHDPEQAEIDRATTLVLPAAFALLTGLGLLVAGAVVYSS